MNDEPTTAVIQRWLDALQGDAPAEPLIRQLLERAVDRFGTLDEWLTGDESQRFTGETLCAIAGRYDPERSNLHGGEV
jgi:hypothetical protein